MLPATSEISTTPLPLPFLQNASLMNFVGYLPNICLRTQNLTSRASDFASVSAREKFLQIEGSKKIYFRAISYFTYTGMIFWRSTVRVSSSLFFSLLFLCRIPSLLGNLLKWGRLKGSKAKPWQLGGESTGRWCWLTPSFSFFSISFLSFPFLNTQ